VFPQPLLGDGVDLVGQIGDVLDDRRIVARGRGQQPNLDLRRD
jgi:hypothetical protein